MVCVLTREPPRYLPQDGYVDWSKVDVAKISIPSGEDMGILRCDGEKKQGDLDPSSQPSFAAIFFCGKPHDAQHDAMTHGGLRVTHCP